MDEKHVNKMARSVMNKRGVDLSLADLRVHNGVCYRRGTVQFIKGRVPDNKEAAMGLVIKALRQQAEIRDVVCEYTLR